jgi:hypothetical protein
MRHHRRCRRKLFYCVQVLVGSLSVAIAASLMMAG